jgi:tetratricopeptide (TPR) repeat protein
MHTKISRLALLLLLFLSPYGKSQTETWQELVDSARACESVLKYRDALLLYQRCLETDTANVDILNALARIESQLGRVAEAERYYKKIVSVDSAGFHANYQIARFYFQQERYKEAIQRYENLLEQDEENGALLRNVGDCYLRMEEPLSAASCYHQAYELNKENASLASSLINTLLRIGGHSAKEALEVCDTALYYNPGSRLLLRNKGMALYTNKKYAEADTLYGKLLAGGDSSYLTLKYAGASCYYAGQYMRAIEPLELAWQKDTASVEVCLLLGSALGKTYDRKRAYTLLDKAEKGIQPSAELLNLLTLFRAETLQKDLRYAEANALYYRVWLDNPKRMDLLYNMTINFLAPNISHLPDEETRQRGLFVNVLYVRENIKNRERLDRLNLNRQLLESFHEDAFFRSLTHLPMLAPDGKRSSISVNDLQALIRSIPL